MGRYGDGQFLLNFLYSRGFISYNKISKFQKNQIIEFFKYISYVLPLWKLNQNSVTACNKCLFYDTFTCENIRFLNM